MLAASRAVRAVHQVEDGWVGDWRGDAFRYNPRPSNLRPRAGSRPDGAVQQRLRTLRIVPREQEPDVLTRQPRERLHAAEVRYPDQVVGQIRVVDRSAPPAGMLSPRTLNHAALVAGQLRAWRGVLATRATAHRGHEPAECSIESQTSTIGKDGRDLWGDGPAGSLDARGLDEAAAPENHNPMGDDRLPGEPLPPRSHVYECPVCGATRTSERRPVCGEDGELMVPKADNPEVAQG